METENLGCCNMVIWDLLMFLLFSCTLLPDTIHIVFRIFIGLAAGLLFMLLCSVPILGVLLNIAAGIFWAFFIWLLFNISDWGFVKDDKISQWTIKILLGLIFVGLHSISMIRHDTQQIKYFFSSKYNFSEFSGNGGSDESKTTHDSTEESTYEDNEEMYQEKYNNETFDPFAGCKTKESIIKRYRSLSKNFHPDTIDGDISQMQILNSLYEKKLKEFEGKNRN